MRNITNKNFNTSLKITDSYGNIYIKKKRLFQISKMVACCLVLSAPLNKASYAGGSFSCCQKDNKEENRRRIQHKPLLKRETTSYVNEEINHAMTFIDNLSQDEKNSANVLILHRDAEKGCVRSQVLLAQNYRVGVSGFEKDFVQAVYWYIKAANQGDRNAQLGLGNIYRIGGFGIERDEAKSIYWYGLAANRV